MFFGRIQKGNIEQTSFNKYDVLYIFLNFFFFKKDPKRTWKKEKEKKDPKNK